VNGMESDLAIARSGQVSGPLTVVDAGGPDSAHPRISKDELFDDGDVRFGVWECTPCTWEVPPRECAETMVIVAGSLRLTSERHGVVELGAGDAFHMPRGWTGTWEALKTVRKIYTVVKG
jgi:uncharacterized protein